MYQYGYWNIVLVNSLIFIIFAFSFVRPKNVRDWRVFGTFSALKTFGEEYVTYANTTGRFFPRLKG